MSIFDEMSHNLAKSLVDMMEVEGQCERKRRDLAMRTDFNLRDCFHLFCHENKNKRGCDVEDLQALLSSLQVAASKDEMFILFYKLDKDKDGYISYSELSDAFNPRQHEYAMLLQSRNGFYGANADPSEYFSP
jgi:Ca2+-binding EF-hand superfamily protein